MKGKCEIRNIKYEKGVRILGLVVVSYFTFQISNFALAASDGAAFLKIGVGARAVGMGGAFVGVANDASAAYWNPAGLAALTRREVLASHSEWLAGMSHDHAAYVHPRLFGGSLGTSLTSLRSTDIDGRDVQGQPTGRFAAADTAFAVTFAKNLGTSRAGITTKFIQQRLADRSAHGAAVDLGLQRPLPVPGLTLGLTLQNLGPRMSFDDSRSYSLPMMLKTGLGYSPRNYLTLAYDMNYEPRSGSLQAAFGAELRPVEALSLRLGYHQSTLVGKESGSLDDANNFLGFQGGIGLKVGSSHRLDYAVVSLGEAGNTQRLSLSAKF